MYYNVVNLIRKDGAKMETNLIDFGRRVKERRLKLGYSQQKLADLLNYTSRSTITKIEKGERDLPIDKLKLLATALKTTPEYLVGWDKEPIKSTKQEWYIDTSMLTQSERFELENILSFNTIQFFKGGNNLTEDEIEELKYILTKLYLKECGYDVK